MAYALGGRAALSKRDTDWFLDDCCDWAEWFCELFVEADTRAAVLAVEADSVVEGDVEELYYVSGVTVEGDNIVERMSVWGETEEGVGIAGVVDSEGPFLVLGRAIDTSVGYFERTAAGGKAGDENVGATSGDLGPRRNTSGVIELPQCYKEAQIGFELSEWIAADLTVEVAAAAMAGTNRSPTGKIVKLMTVDEKGVWDGTEWYGSHLEALQSVPRLMAWNL
ncbi:hypothetical protein IW261DRAFT_1423513 [Armillaria novae-zelandiae]|uniref:Uncharacterized protein n=1 Tax=Armillaria novae-zelandiae TaxID=153914 RepID=A0AA39T9F0_9AGAR|nr:hypothetical protein IW261DRAFT_1423513 [Armillaria novae-zelandiae]